jgi:hypothetical protein
MCIHWLKMASSVVGIAMLCSHRISRLVSTDICLVFLPYYVGSERFGAQRGSPLHCAMRNEIARMYRRTTLGMLLTVLFLAPEQMVARLSLLRHYAVSRKVSGSNTDEIIAFFYLTNPSSRTTALGLTQYVTEMRTRNVPGG